MEPQNQSIDVPVSETGEEPVTPSQEPQSQPSDAGTPPTGEPTPSPTPATPAEPQVELFETPDGRKVDAATLQREWKENFLPDYTRKSQLLAEQQRQQQPITQSNFNSNQTPGNPYADPNWVPQSYAELMEVTKQQALEQFRAEQRAEQERVQHIEEQVSAQLTELKTADPSLNENALFVHATKYGFQDLKAAYANMKDMQAMVKTVQQQTVQNVQKRAQEPIATQPGQANGTLPNRNDFRAARDFLRSIK